MSGRFRLFGYYFKNERFIALYGVVGDEMF